MNNKESIESLLQVAFRPVSPREEYITAAKQRVLNTPPAAEINLVLMTIIALVGLLAGLVILIAGIRVARSLLNSRG